MLYYIQEMRKGGSRCELSISARCTRKGCRHSRQHRDHRKSPAWLEEVSNLDKEREGREPFLKFLVLIISHLKCYEEDFLSHPVLHGGFPCDPVSYRLGKCKRP